MIFDKACQEPVFASMYAQLCMFLHKNLPKFEGALGYVGYYACICTDIFKMSKV